LSQEATTAAAAATAARCRYYDTTAAALQERSTAIVRIEGHCDERGSDAYNMALGEKRAATARDYLIKYGIAANRLSIISYGESRPVAFGSNEDAWAKNRRAEFKIISE